MGQGLGGLQAVMRVGTQYNNLSDGKARVGIQQNASAVLFVIIEMIVLYTALRVQHPYRLKVMRCALFPDSLFGMHDPRSHAGLGQVQAQEGFTPQW